MLLATPTGGVDMGSEVMGVQLLKCGENGT